MGSPYSKQVDDAQHDVSEHFDSTASYWDSIYGGETLQGAIYLRRQAAVLDEVDAAGLPPGAAVLEIGCGAGLLSVELARRGIRLDAVDASEAMVALTAARLRENEVEGVTQMSDVHALPFPSGGFDAVIAVGVIPWLHSPQQAVIEMARVLAPGGELIVTADSRARLVSFLDPRLSIIAAPLKLLRDAARRRRGQAVSRLHLPRRLDRLLAKAGLRVVQRRTVGFGPFTFMGRPLMSEARALRTDTRLQKLADRQVALIRWTGWHYLARARKPA